MYKKYIDEIKRASQKKTLTFFVGAGVSKVSDYPGWGELIDKFSQELGLPEKYKANKEDRTKSSYSSDEYLSIPQRYYYSINKDKRKYYSLLKSYLDNSDISYNRIHDLMLQLRPASFITTNYDTLIEQASIANGQLYFTIANDASIPDIDGEKFILKIHGDFSGRNIVLKEEDYLNYSENFKVMETFVKSIFATNTVVFIGYGLGDYNIKLILNWVKEALGIRKFRMPYFIHTDDSDINSIEKLYQESRGLRVIDWHDFVSSPTNHTKYSERYCSVLSVILDKKRDNIISKQALFQDLYNRLSPLNKLNALRRKDIQQAVDNSCIVSENGIIYSFEDKPDFFEFYCELYEYKKAGETIPSEYMNEFDCITNILQKAWIHAYQNKKNREKLLVFDDFRFSYGHQCVWASDYQTMENVANRKHSDLYHEYQKGYYLVKLSRHDEAYYVYKEVAIKAYIEKNYLLFFLAQKCRLMTYKMIENHNRYLMSYGRYQEIIDTESDYIRALDEDAIFLQLPYTIRNQFFSFKDLYSLSSLYKELSESLINVQKHEKHIQSKSVAFGMTPAGKIIESMNEQLHFAYGNFIPIDEFTEFTTGIKEQLKAMVYQISHQYQIKSLDDETLNPFAPFKESDISLDEKDFYCFITYFSREELRSIFSIYEITKIDFSNSELVFRSVHNLLNYYQANIYNFQNNYHRMFIENKIEKVLTVLRFVNVPIETTESIVSCICKYPSILYREVNISVLYFFLYAQVSTFKNNSTKLRKLILTLILFFIDKENATIDQKEKFQLNSSATHINYPCLARFLSIGDKNIIYPRLSKAVKKILDCNNDYGPYWIDQYYYNVDKQIKKEIELHISKKLSADFNFISFEMLINHQKSKISSGFVSDLVNYMRRSYIVGTNTNHITIGGSDLTQLQKMTIIAEWCIIGWIKKTQILNLLGYEEKFDFLLEPTKFDHQQIQIAWLKDLHKSTEEYLCSFSELKESIRNKIHEALLNSSISKDDACQMFIAYGI